VVNSKAIGVIIAGLVITVILTALLSGQNQDNTQEITLDHSQDESIAVSDSATLSKNNPNYTIDEFGNKKFLIIADDSPDIGE